MSNRTAKFASALFASVLAGACLATIIDIGTARAADDCLAAPKGATPEGSHWYYRIDHATKRHCWYLRDKAKSTAQTAAHSTRSGNPRRRKSRELRRAFDRERACRTTRAINRHRTTDQKRAPRSGGRRPTTAAASHANLRRMRAAAIGRGRPLARSRLSASPVGSSAVAKRWASIGGRPGSGCRRRIRRRRQCPSPRRPLAAAELAPPISPARFRCCWR